nr:ribonuclease H-like domain-containing protein [Tanacetum cinerariifolium]
MPNVNIPWAIDIGGRPRCQETIGGGYTPGSDEGRITLAELIEICTIFSNRVTQLATDLSTTKSIYNKAFITLTNIVKKLESQLKQKRSKAVIYSPDEEGPSMHIEDSPKQGRIIKDMDKDENINLVRSSKKQRLDQQTDETKEEVKAQGDSDQEVEELKLYMRKIPKKDIAIKAIPLAIKTSVIIEDDLETLWKLVKDKYGNTKPEEGFQPSDGYHAVPPPYTGIFMPPKPNLVFNTAPTTVETDHPTFTVQLSPIKPEQDLSLTNRPSAPIIEDRYVKTSIPADTPKPASLQPTSNSERRNRKACFVCKSLDHLIKDCDYHEKKMDKPTARNHVHRGYHKQYAPMTSQNPQKHMVPAAVLTQSKLVSITVVRLVSVVVPKSKVTRPRHATPIVTKTNLPIKRHLTRSLLGIKCIRHSHCWLESSHCQKELPTALRRMPLPEEKCCHCQKFALRLLLKRNRQSKMTVSYRLVPHVSPFILAVTAAILKTFGGNEATKKRKKNLLKQQYGNFKAEESETLEQTFNRLQVIVSQLPFMEVEVEKDDLNQKFLTSLAPEWLMHTIVWRNRNDLDTMSLDDLYNHLKVYEVEVQKKSNLNSQNMAFISSSKHSSGDEDGNTAGVSTSSTTFPTASASVATISQDTASAYIASQSNDKFWKRSGKKISIQGSDVAGFDKSKVECFNCHKMGHFIRECRAPRSQERGRKENYRHGSKAKEKTPKALMAIDGNNIDDKGYWDSSCSRHMTGLLKASKNFNNLIESQRSDKVMDGVGYNVVPPPATDPYLSPKKDLSWTGLPEFVDDTVTDYSRPSPTVASTSTEGQNKNSTTPEDVASPNIPKPFMKFVKPKDSQSESKTNKHETPKKPQVKYAEQYRHSNKKPNVKGNQRNWNNLKSYQLGPEFVLKKKACFNYGDFSYFANESAGHRPHGASMRLPHRSAGHRPHRAPMRPSHRPASHRPHGPSMNHMRPNMNGARPNRSFFIQAHLYETRPFLKSLAVKSQYRAPWVPTVNRNNPPVNRKFSTGRRNFPTINKKFPTASRKFTTSSTKIHTADMGKKGKSGSSQNNIDDKGYWDSGCSRHMIGNISYLSNFEPFDGGYVSFGQGGCKITGKGTIKTDKLKFENLYFVKDLKYNLFSMSQICDNKNNVLFDTECIVLGRNFKLLDDANILLRTPRQHNMYSINLNNIVPHKDLTCLVAKASADECIH